MQAYCETTLNYGSGEAVKPVPMIIYNGRSASDLSLGTSGFELIRHRSAVSDWHSQAEIDGVHYAEIRTLAKEISGCDWVLFFPAIVRSPDQAAKTDDYHPIQFVHSDYTENYPDGIRDRAEAYHRIIAPFMADEGITADEVEKARRILTLQFWRNVGPAVVDYPICFCDSRTVSRDELSPILVAEYGGMPTNFEAFTLSPPGKREHRWYTFPQMTVDEAVVFRSFDSDLVAAGKPFWTPHSAFFDTTAPADAPLRESIEMRAICLFK